LAEVSDGDAYLRISRRIVRNTVAVNYLGRCAITLPVGLEKARMPVGLQLIGPAWTEEKLLGIALAAERVLGTATERLGNLPSLS
jgi:aspartyl-tRNA(Asn)/glutamyl-tRNA(Gln) amidotransferase subunit A